MLQSQKKFMTSIIHTMFRSFTESMSEVGNFLPIEALQYPQTYSATASQRLPTEALQYPQTYSATASQRLPTEALQTYSTSGNQRLKRTYGIKRDRNRRSDQVGTVFTFL
jgi:hypothetical protein